MTTEELRSVQDLLDARAKYREEIKSLRKHNDEMKQWLADANEKLERTKVEWRECWTELRTRREQDLDWRTLEVASGAVAAMRKVRKTMPVAGSEELAGLNENNGLWRAVFEVLETAREGEVDMALMPNLSDDMRHYRAGRAAGMADAQMALAEAERVAKEGKG